MLAVIERVRSGYQHAALVIAVCLFIVGAVLAAMSIDIDLKSIKWWLLFVVAVVGVPPTIALNAAEIRAAAIHGGGAAIPWARAVGVAVAGTAANLLPVPGAAIVRIEALTASGATGRRAVRATLGIGAIWVAVSAIAAAILLAETNTSAALISAGIGIAAGVGAGAIVGVRANRRWTVKVAGIEVAALAVTALRLWAISAAIGIDLALHVAALMAVSYAISSAVGFFPGGLGLREAVSSGLGALAGAAGSTGFVLSAIDRVIGLIVHVLVGAMLVMRGASSHG